MIEPRAASRIGSRIVITGMAGAGKSTLARALAGKTGLPLIHLDLYSWKPGWIRVEEHKLLETQRELFAGEKWIVDSNDVDKYLLLSRADTLVVLDVHWRTCAWRAFKRGIRRPAGTRLPEGCEESLLQRLGDEGGIVWRNWRHRDTIRRRELGLAEVCEPHMVVHVLHSPEEVAAFPDAFDGGRIALGATRLPERPVRRSWPLPETAVRAGCNRCPSLRAIRRGFQSL